MGWPAATWRSAALLLLALGFAGCPSVAAAAQKVPVPRSSRRRGLAHNGFLLDEALEVHVYKSNSPYQCSFDVGDLLWSTSLNYTDGSARLTADVTIEVTPHMRNNGSVYGHVFFSRGGNFPNPRSRGHVRRNTVRTVLPLTKYAAVRPPSGLRNLLTHAAPPWEADLLRAEKKAKRTGRSDYIAYWIPSLRAQLVFDDAEYNPNALSRLPASMYSDADMHQGVYQPYVWANDLAVIEEKLVALNGTSPMLRVPLEVQVSTMSMNHFEWLLQFRESLRIQEQQLGMGGKEMEDMRLMIADTNKYLLMTTFGVSFLHLAFDILAFKNDVSFWRNVDTMEGLSWRSIVLNIFCEAVVLAYLAEQGASWLIKISGVLTLSVDAWKAFKLFGILAARKLLKEDAKGVKDARQARRGEGTKEGKQDEEGTKEGKQDEEDDQLDAAALTEKYDRLAFVYLSPGLLLVVVAYTAYSLVYEFHRGWLAWGLGSLASLVYSLGFVVMTPQLFINHKLKSVAALPWKPFMYKALNTVVDDLFAFIIRMPTMHRISAFRDDVVFAILMYQRWKYPVDNTRLNEFGQRGVELDDKKGEAGEKKETAVEQTQNPVAADAGGGGGKKKKKKKVQ